MTRDRPWPLLRGLALSACLLSVCRPPAPDTASTSKGDLRITGGFAYEPVSDASAAAYLEIANQGKQADTLLGATSPIAAGTMLHGEGMMGMAGVVIPPGGRVLFEPGGAHIMLMTLSSLPKAGDSLRLSLHFARTGDVTVALPVRKYGTP
ncbi:MAG TPA: copper chaperone PCu(A)C [Gemmatimonadales bacterium]|nr:copper chaperone PCu(A)C [Gemmatimonadales bacterium]